RLNWESRVGGSEATIRRLENELADYLLFIGEAPPSAAATPNASFAKRLEAKAPKDHLGRSCAQLDATDRLMRYPCSYVIYSEAFDGLPPTVKPLVYQRMLDVLTRDGPRADRRAVLEILRETKSDFPDER